MNFHGVQIPGPSRFISLDEIDSIAQTYERSYREGTAANSFPFDIERFLDWLEISYYWDNLQQTEGVTCFARINLDQRSTVEINEHYRAFFEDRPDVFRVCLGHEAGHLALNHPAFFSSSDAPAFFEPRDGHQFLHKQSWNQYGLTSAEVRERIMTAKAAKEKLLVNAMINKRAYDALKMIDDKCEPEWMFWQAEHFARCIAIPKDKLFEVLEVEPFTSGWSQVYRLVELFEVPVSSMRTRLEKLKIMELDGRGNPIAVVNPQPSLF